MSFGKKVREARLTLGLTQKSLAERIGVLEHQVSDWEIDKVVPRFESAIDIADTLGVSLDWLAERKETDPNLNKYRRIMERMEDLKHELLQH